MKLTGCTLYSLSAFQQYQKHNKRYAPVWEISMWQTKQNKLPCFIDRLLYQIGSVCTVHGDCMLVCWPVALHLVYSLVYALVSKDPTRLVWVETKDLRYYQSSTSSAAKYIYTSHIPAKNQPWTELLGPG